MKQYRKTYNDGYLQYGGKQTVRAGRGKNIGQEYVVEGSLAYSELSCRDQDYQMAEILSRSLDLKIKTPLPPDYRQFSRKRVQIGNTFYDVIKSDPDRTNGELYLYLQEVGK